MKEIMTERLVLRQFKDSDYDDLYEYLSQLRDDEFERQENWIWKS